MDHYLSPSFGKGFEEQSGQDKQVIVAWQEVSLLRLCCSLLGAVSSLFLTNLLSVAVLPGFPGGC
jgi:hypothetical protein